MQQKIKGLSLLSMLLSLLSHALTAFIYFILFILCLHNTWAAQTLSISQMRPRFHLNFTELDSPGITLLFILFFEPFPIFILPLSMLYATTSNGHFPIITHFRLFWLIHPPVGLGRGLLLNWPDWLRPSPEHLLAGTVLLLFRARKVGPRLYLCKLGGILPEQFACKMPAHLSHNRARTTPFTKVTVFVIVRK